MQVGLRPDLVAARGPLSAHKPSVSQRPARKTARGRPRLQSNPEGSQGLPLRAMSSCRSGRGLGAKEDRRQRSDMEDPSRQEHTSKSKEGADERDAGQQSHGQRRKGREHTSSTAPYSETEEPMRSRSNRRHTRGLARRPASD